MRTKTKEKLKNTKNGISLITLVITIKLKIKIIENTNKFNDFLFVLLFFIYNRYNVIFIV